MPSKTRESAGNETSGTPCILVYLQSIRRSGEMQLIKKERNYDERSDAEEQQAHCFLMAINKKEFRPHDRSNRHDKAVICFDCDRRGRLGRFSGRPGVWFAALQSVETKKTILYVQQQKPAGVFMRTGLFLVITKRIVIISYRRFGATYRRRLKGSRMLFWNHKDE